MKIGVLGGSGLIGSELVKRLRDQGHQAVPHHPPRASTRSLARLNGVVEVAGPNSSVATS